MTFEQDISDTRELVERYPEKCDAYIGVSQLVDNRRPAGIARDWLVDEITEDNNPDDLEHLEQIPHLEVSAYFIMGANDYNTPNALVEEYLEDSAHLPLLGERDRFSQVIGRSSEPAMVPRRAAGSRGARSGHRSWSTACFAGSRNARAINSRAQAVMADASHVVR
jgi:hypothetical protein